MKWQEISKKLEEKGILLSIADICSVTGMGRGTIEKVLARGGVMPCGSGTGRRYFSDDVAKAIVSYR